jgi:hypothetical protein
MCQIPELGDRVTYAPKTPILEVFKVRQILFSCSEKGQLIYIYNQPISEYFPLVRVHHPVVSRYLNHLI